MPLFQAVSGDSFSFIQLLDSRSSGTQGGSFTANAWTPRPINTIATDETGLVNLATNTFILPAGKYYLDCKAASYLGNAQRLRLQNTTDNTTILLGMSLWNFVAASEFLKTSHHLPNHLLWVFCNF